jgi:microfibrillar-associated protein 1
MQKSYKVGAYHMDKAKEGGKWAILNRDYNAPVGEDKFDKSNLPMILQKRRGDFGKKG